MTTTEADIQLIQRILPHRYPFLLVDRVRDIVHDTSAVGLKNVTANEPQFQGHFPGRPLLPGVTMVEAMAQTAAVMFGVSRDLVDQGALVYFMGIDKARFRRRVVPGDALELHIKALRAGSRNLRIAGTGMVGEQTAAEAEFSAMIVAPED